MERVLQKRSEKEKQEEITSATEMNNPVSKTINMKLPKIEIKRFSGEPKEYKSFKHAFEIYLKSFSIRRSIQISKRFSRHNREL